MDKKLFPTFQNFTAPKLRFSPAMTFLPIVERELRVAARRKSTYGTRMSAAVAATIFGGYALFIYSRMGGMFGGGRMVFSTVSGFAFIYCLFVGVRNACDCVSEEKREGTLGLLFLTDLKGYDVVLGKLLATGINSFYALMAAFPIMGIALILGGITGAEFWRVVLALLNILFFSHAAALMISTFSRNARKAFGGALGLALIFLVLFPAVAEILRHYYPGSPFIWWLQVCNPWHAFQTASMLGTRSGNFWTSLLLTNLLGWIFLAVASFFLPHVWQDKAASVRTMRWRERWQRWCLGDVATRAARRKKLVEANPFLWLVSRDRLKGVYFWTFLGALACLWLWIWLKFSGWNYKEPFFIVTILILHSTLKLWIASEASCHFEEQRQSGALELILSCTPLDVPDILRGQWQALRRLFVWPLVAVLVVDALMVLVGFWDAGFWNHAAPRGRHFSSQGPMAMIAAMLMLIADVIALGWVGMWNGISSKPKHAAGKTVGQVLILPWLIFYFLCAVLTVGSFIGIARGWDFSEYLALWFALGIGVDLGFGLWSRHRVRRDFRALAAPQTQEYIGVLGQLGRALGNVTRNISSSSSARKTEIPPVIYHK